MKGKNPFTGLIWGGALICLLVGIIYIPAINGDFIWDDDAFLTENPLIKAPDGLSRFWFSTEAPDYFPLTSTTLWLEWRLWGENATGYHVVNVLLHILNTLLIWAVLRRLKIPGAWLAALIFGIHPVNVESVAWITERKNLLPMVFFLTSILSYLTFDKHTNGWFYFLSLAAFLLALLSKTSVIMLPFVLLGCIWWQRGRIAVKDLLRSVPFFGLSLIMGAVTLWFQYHNAIASTIVREDGFLSRLAMAGRAIWFYLYKAVFPFNLSFVYPRWEMGETSAIHFLPLICLAGLMGLFYYYRYTWGKPFLLGAGYFMVTLFPVLGFFNIYFMKYSLVADHWQYTSIIGIIALIVGLIAHKYKSWVKGYRGVAVGVAAVLICLFSVLSWKRAETFAHSESLWNDTLHKNPNCWMAYNILGGAFAQKGEWKRAMQYFGKALEIKPDYPKAHSNLANVLYDQGYVSQSFRHFEEALRIDPDAVEVHYNYGTALAEQGRVKEAVDHYLKAIRLKPDLLQAHYNLGILYAQQKKFKKAIRQLEQVLRIDPGHMPARQNLIRLHQFIGKGSGSGAKAGK
ncbi:MAG: tetratricopeptide repeat protein [Deltaproteobacteria bacterium]|nr:tetratricopeptide repeat protein [Deltaproteobacteria bacterium]